MADVHSSETRSFNMSQIRSQNTKPELLIRKNLFSNGFRYRLHKKELPGKPDIVLNKYKTVIFVNGCFWHGHDNCRYFKMPSTRTEWWAAKINRTKERDVDSIKKLKKERWHVIVIYECQLKNEKLNKTIDRVIKQLNKWRIKTEIGNDG